MCLCVLAAQLCLTLCDPMDCSPPRVLIKGTVINHMNILMKLEVLLYCLKVSGEFALFLLLKNCAMTYPLPRFKKKIANSLVWNT